VNEFGEIAFTDTPLASDFDARQFIAPEQAQGLPRQVQRFGGLPKS
jgi:hypothetical protein